MARFCAGKSEASAVESSSVASKQSDKLQTAAQAQPVVIEGVEIKDKGSIETMLARARRREIIERVGPEAERYLPSKDVNSFLLPDERLRPEERWWQKVFVILPWATFAVMLCVPMLLVTGNLGWLQQMADKDRESAEQRAAQLEAARVEPFRVLNFGQMPDVLERPGPSLVLLFDPSTFASKVYLPAFRDLASTIQRAGIMCSVVALDMSQDVSPPEEFQWEYPRSLTPHLQLIVPRARDGEAGVIDYDGRWTAVSLFEAARKLDNPFAPRVSNEDLANWDAKVDRLRSLLFELYFIEDGCDGKKSGWFRQGKQPLDAATLDGAKHSIDLSGGLEDTIQACEAALSRLRSRSQNS